MDIPVILPEIRAIKTKAITKSELVSAHNFERFLPCCFCCGVVWSTLAQPFDRAAGAEEQAVEEGFRKKGRALPGPLYIADVL